MRNFLLVLALLVVLAPASAGAVDPGGAYNFVTLTANVAAKVPAQFADINGRTQLYIQNLNATEVWCGYDANVTALNGTRVAPNGNGFNFVVGWDGNLNRVQIWCITTVNQTGTTNLRWNSVR